METFQRDRYAALGIDLPFVQDNFSSSQRGTLRGLHYQLERPQGKLVWVTRGEVWDVAVDVRVGSETYGQSFGTTLSTENHRQLWIPPGYAHGFLVISDVADFVYKTTAYYSPEDERSIAWDDPELVIPWPLADLGGAPTLSARDRDAPRLATAELPGFVP
jgi:dTDP-4-dehydrorhamnose 3,5-epimerase